MVDDTSGGGLDGSDGLGYELVAEPNLEKGDLHVQRDAVEVALLDGVGGVGVAQFAAFVTVGAAEDVAEEGELVGFQAVAVDAIEEGEKGGVLKDLAVEEVDGGAEGGVAAGLFVEAGLWHGFTSIGGVGRSGQD